MKRFSILAITLCAFCGSASAQQALFGGQMPLSPEIHADKTVTFRCMASEAHKVQITGDFLPTKKVDTPMGKYDMPGVADLKKDEKGVWSFTTTAPLAPELYSYTMMVDGASVTDHLNVYTVRDIANEYIYDNFDKKLADLFAAKPKLFWIGIGNTDFLFKDNTAFREKLTKNHYPFTYMETDGGHIWRNWRIHLGEFAQKIFK